MKSYDSITSTYLSSHGLTKYTYNDYLGERRVAFLTKTEGLRRGFERPSKVIIDKIRGSGREATQSKEVSSVVTKAVFTSTILASFAALRDVIATEQNLSAVR